MDEIATQAVHAARVARPANEPGVQPLYGPSGWTFESVAQIEGLHDGTVKGVQYGTLGGPNHDALEQLMAALEGAPAAVCANGGMTAISSCLHELLRPGGRIVAARDLFGPTERLLVQDFARWGVAVELVDATDLDDLERALRDADVLYAEIMSNPRLRVVDIPALAELAHAHGALLVIDNTFASPALCRPLALGADLVVESLTKYVGGHYDCVAGVVAGAPRLIEPMRAAMKRSGHLPSPFEAWLCVRGAQTLALRVDAACRGAARLATWLAEQPAMQTVIYPGLPTHPDHDTARRLLGDRFGGVLALELAGGRAAVDRFVERLRLIRLLSSLGGVATTLNHPASTSHVDVSPERRREAGIHDGLLRMAVGIEAVEDLIADLEQALYASA